METDVGRMSEALSAKWGSYGGRRYAFPSGIVAGLWDINDEATSILMGMFYKHLQIEQRPAHALHKAKLEWLQKKELQSFQQLPYFWAGMVYSGDNLPVNLPTKKTSGNLWWIALFVAAGILFIYFKRKGF